MQSFNQIIKTLQGIATAHKQIKQFGVGDEWELVLNEDTYREFTYPILWVVPQPAQVEGTVVTTMFRIIVADIVRKDESIENEVLSDTFQIALDVMAQMYDIQQGQHYVWEAVRSSQLVPFTEKYDDYLSGWGFELRLQQYYNWSACAVPSGTPSGYSPEYVTIYASNGVTVLATINPGGSYTVVTSPCDDATVTVNGDAFETLAAGDTLPIIVTDENDAPVTVTLAPLNDQISIPSIPVLVNGGGGLDPVSPAAANYPLNIHDTAAADVGTVTGIDTVTITNASVTVNGSAFDTVVAEGSIDVPVVDTDDANVGTISGGKVVIADCTFSINGAAPEAILAEQAQSINVYYDDATAVGTVAGANVTVPDNRYNVSSIARTGRTTSTRAQDDGDEMRGRGGANFTTLGSNNPFGNTTRFLDELGGTTFANNIVVDWLYADYVNELVPMWYRVPSATNTWNNHIDSQPITVGAFADWMIPNDSERHSICNRKASAPYNYAPFNISSVTGGVMFTSTPNAASPTTVALCFNVNSGTANAIALGITNAVITNSYSVIYIRYATFTEAGV